jgi:hypothetical protein
MLGMLGDKKKIAQVILGERPMMDEKKVPNGLEADFSTAYGALSKDIMSAIEEKSAERLAASLKSMIQAIVREEEYKEDQAEEMEG